MKDREEMIISRLLLVIKQLRPQLLPRTGQPAFENAANWLRQVYEYLAYHNEYGIAFDEIVGCLEDPALSKTLTLSAAAAIALLEAGLVLGMKTERDEDRPFNCHLSDGERYA